MAAHWTLVRSLAVAAVAGIQFAGPPRAGAADVIAWGMDFLDGSTTNVPPGLSNVVWVETAPALSLALKADGTIAAWGDNAQGQLDAIARLTNVAALSGGFSHVLALNRNGTVDVAAWGNNIAQLTNVPPHLSNVVAVAAGSGHSLALRDNSTVVAWGEASPGIPFPLPPGLSNVVAIQATGWGGLALKADGTVVSLGRFATAPPPGLTNVVAISTGFSENFLALRSDGSTIVWTTRTGASGFRDALPVPSGLDPLIAANVENYHSLGVAPDATLRVWKLRDGPAPESYLQIPPAAASNVIAIASGRTHNLVLVGEPGWPIITRQPEDILATDGQTATLRVEASSALPLQYQWYFNGLSLPGATNADLAVENVNASKAGPYGVVVSAGARRARSQPAWLKVLPIIEVQLAQNQVILSWPLSGADYWLEEADGPDQPFRSAFENVRTNDVLGRIEATITSADRARFFRLFEP